MSFLNNFHLSAIYQFLLHSHKSQMRMILPEQAGNYLVPFDKESK